MNKRNWVVLGVLSALGAGVAGGGCNFGDPQAKPGDSGAGVDGNVVPPVGSGDSSSDVNAPDVLDGAKGDERDAPKPTPDAACAPVDGKRCAAGNRAVETCGSSGAWVAEACPGAFPVCKANLWVEECTPGTKRCQGGGSVQTCQSDSTWGAAVACGAAVPFCNGDGVCGTGITCTAGKTRCQGNSVETCGAGGDSWSAAVACPALTPVCSGEGTCGIIECTPGELGCNSNSKRTCQADSRWGAASACPAATPVCSGEGVCGTVPSCAGGLTCQGRDCCESIVVPGGTFLMGRSAAGTDASPPGMGGDQPDEQPEHGVTVSSFALDTFLVTVGRYRKFVDAYAGPPAAGAGTHPRIPGTGWSTTWNAALPASAAALRESAKCDSTFQTWTDAADPTTDRRPINCVNWYVAFAFCAWDGGWLPTEAEWEYVAAGGNENRLYPWGSAAPTQSRAPHDCLFDGVGSCGATDLPMVGSTPAGNGRWGHETGALGQWLSDWYSDGWYSGGGAACTNCTNSTAASWRVVRGGSYGGVAWQLRAADRGYTSPGDRSQNVGIRCARTP